MEFIIISGLSGAGKSSAAAFLEDLGFYCVDNMPVALISNFAGLCMAGAGTGKYSRVALVTDIRGGQTFDELFQALDSLTEMHLEYQLLFIEAADEDIVRLYKETRHTHPLTRQGYSLPEAVKLERMALEPVRRRASHILNSTGLNLSKFRGELLRLFGMGAPEESMTVAVTSFGFKHGIPIDVEFLYTAQDPNMGRARDMAELMLDLYLDGQLDEVYVLFTKMVSSFQMEPTAHKLLPLDPDVFPEYEKNRDSYNRDVVYVPSVKAVMDRLVPGYVKGDLFGALVESYCSEQNARLTAMKSSSDNARAMLQRLNLSFNRARQAAITQEITEVVGGAQAAL